MFCFLPGFKKLVLSSACTTGLSRQICGLELAVANQEVRRRPRTECGRVLAWQGCYVGLVRERMFWVFSGRSGRNIDRTGLEGGDIDGLLYV